MTSATLPATKVAAAAGRSLERHYSQAQDFLATEQVVDAEDRLRNLESLAAAARQAAAPEEGFVDVSSEDFSLIRDYYEP